MVRGQKYFLMGFASQKKVGDRCIGQLFINEYLQGNH